MLLKLAPVQINVSESSSSYDELNLLKLLKQILGIGIRGHCSYCPLLVVCDIQLSTLHENADYTRDVLFSYSQMKWSATIHVLRARVSPKLLQEDFCKVSVALTCSPMEGCHLKLIYIEGQIRVCLQQSLHLLIARFDHSKKLFAIIIVKRFFHDAFVFLDLS